MGTYTLISGKNQKRSSKDIAWKILNSKHPSEMLVTSPSGNALLWKMIIACCPGYNELCGRRWHAKALLVDACYNADYAFMSALAVWQDLQSNIVFASSFASSFANPRCSLAIWATFGSIEEGAVQGWRLRMATTRTRAE